MQADTRDAACGGCPAAQRSWRRVEVDAEEYVVGMVTDRDVCMAAYTQGQALAATLVNTAMAKAFYTCAPGDSVADTEVIMKGRQVRRLPVVDDAGHLVGLLSLNDIARHAAKGREKRDITAGTRSCRP